MEPMRYRFGAFELDGDSRRLTGPEGEIHLEPQVFDVLVHLVTHRSRVVPKEELLDAVWGSRFVSPSALTTRIREARSALGDTGRRQDLIRTSHGTGYQFTAEVEELPHAAGAGPVAAAPRPSRRLPETSNVFRGREQELRELADLLGEERLVTIIGPGGTGKTRLSIEAAAGYEDSVDVTGSAAFVDLAAVRADQAVGQALAAGLGIDSGIETDVVGVCTTYLRTHRTMLIIDNCEHLVDAAAALVARILADAPRTIVLATSRVPLGHPEERLYWLQPLPVLLPTEDLTVELASHNAAVALFCDRAERVRQDFELDDASLGDVVALCAALDGLPLALELAAGRMGVFSVDDLLARLDRRLDILGGQRAAGDARQRTLRATLNWSYELLEPACQRLFRHLAVFPAGLVLEDIEWLGEQIGLEVDPAVALEGLVESSLVGRTETPSGTRYSQLETMRTFGTDLLRAGDEHDLALDLAAGWALRLTSDVHTNLRSPRETYWNDRVRREIPNIREARLHLRRCDRVADLVRISADLDEWAYHRDASELWAWCDELAEIGADDSTRATIAAVRSTAAWRRGRIDETAEQATIAVEKAGDDWTRARGLSSLWVALFFRGEYEQANELWNTRHDQADHPMEHANSLLARAYHGEPVEARTEVDELRARVAELGAPCILAWIEYVTGEIAARAGDDDAVQWLERAIERAHAFGGTFIVGVAGVTVCSALAADGDVVGAASRYRDLVEHWLRTGTWTQLWTTLRNIAPLFEPSHPELALRIIDAADADPYAPGMDGPATAAIEALRARLRAEVGSATAASAIDRAELAEETRAALAELVATARDRPST
jgi:predicted ATPase/DNA-binding winged helix-turn-helix (wHTH) protein